MYFRFAKIGKMLQTLSAEKESGKIFALLLWNVYCSFYIRNNNNTNM